MSTTRKSDHTATNRWALIVLVALSTLTGCAGGSMFSKIDANLTNGDCPAAMALIEQFGEAADPEENLLYLLDAAMVTMQCGDFDTAQARFRNAEDLADRLWTESITRNLLSLITNDRVLPYAGEDFERVMIHLMSAIGYLQTGQTDAALVEARRLDTLLAVYNDRYDRKNIYKEDAFARYLSGILHEADGAWDDAFIDYRRAADVYRVDYRDYGVDLPDMLVADLVRAAAVVDRTEEIRDIVSDARIEGGNGSGMRTDHGKVVFITFAGYAPYKVQDLVPIPTPHGPVGMAFPRMVVTPPRCSHGRLNLYGDADFFEADLVLVEDINRIAVKNLDDREGRILAKAVARAVAKQVAIHQIASASDNSDDQRTIETVLNLVNILLVERADTRSWRTLPGRIYMTRIHLPAGQYRGELEACGEMTVDLGTLTVAPGTTRYLFRDLRYPAPVGLEAMP